MKILATILILSSLAQAQEIGINREEVRTTIKKNLKDVRTCYEDHIKNQEKSEGKIVAEWDITSSGSVSGAEIKSSTLKNESVETCLLGKILTWKFPPSPRGALAHIAYPFYFASDKK